MRCNTGPAQAKLVWPAGRARAKRAEVKHSYSLYLRPDLRTYFFSPQKNRGVGPSPARDLSSVVDSERSRLGKLAHPPASARIRTQLLKIWQRQIHKIFQRKICRLACTCVCENSKKFHRCQESPPKSQNVVGRVLRRRKRQKSHLARA